jgi:copper chaperone NosL
MVLLAGLLFLVPLLFAGQREDLEQHPSCRFCGMDRNKFAHSRMLIEYDDGTSFGACSLHCAAVDLAGTVDKSPLRILVGDYSGRKLVDAERAFWVIGGARPGVMTRRAKWAFEGKTAAERFVAEHGGVAATFEAALKAAYEDMYEDTKQIRERRSLKRSGAQVP